MKIAVMLLVAIVLMMCQEADSWWKFNHRTSWLKRDGETAEAIQERIIGPQPYNSALWRSLVRRWLGKREVRDAESDAVYNAAAEDGVFTDEEIQSVFGVDENGLAEFKENFDVNGDGKIEVKEYEMVKTISSNVNQGE